MNSFENTFSGFISSCATLHDLLVPVSLAILVASFGFFFWGTPQHPIELVKFLAKLFLIVLLIINAGNVITNGQQSIQSFVADHVAASPEKVAQRYKDKLAAAEGDPSIANQSWWNLLFSSNFFEALIYAALLLLSWLAMAVLFYVYIFQKVVLLLCWVLSPLLFACFAIPIVSGLALRHLLRILGILFWPLGLALAATVTEGLLDMQTDQSFLFGGSVTGQVEYVLINLLAIAAIGLWILFSSVLAPAAMQRLISGGAGSAAMIPRAAELLVNPGLPVTGSLISRVQQFQESRSTSTSHESQPSLIRVEPVPSSPVEAPSLRSPGADDPTAENAVRKVMEEDDDSLWKY